MLHNKLFLQTDVLAETCYSVSSFLPKRAITAMQWCEALGTMKPRATVEEFVRMT